MKRTTLLLLPLVCLALYTSAQQDAFKYRMSHRDSIWASYLGSPFPLFDITTADGRKYTSANTSGKIVYINLWSSGCQPCRTDFEELNHTYNELKSDTSFVFLSATYDEPSVIPALLKQFKITYPAGYVSKEQMYRYNFGWGFPTNIIIDKNGKIAYFSSGGHTDKDKAEEEIKNGPLKKIKELLAD